MGAVLFALMLIGIFVLFAYLKFPPAYADRKLVRVFDMMVLGVCAVLCLAWFFNIQANWSGTANDRWWKPVAFGGALGIETLFLGIALVLRNFWIFKPPRRPGSGWF